MNFDPVILIYFIVLLFSITIHEASHGWMAERCGDPTAASMGRVTLNPLPHIDPIGTIIIPLSMMIFNPSIMLLGWGKPCPVNPYKYKKLRRDDILVSLAGVTANLIAALASLVLFKILSIANIHIPSLFKLLGVMFQLNLVLIAFNLIPIPPLDGSHVLMHLLPDHAAEKYERLDRWGFLILILLINIPLFHLYFDLFLYPFNRLFVFIMGI